MNKTKYLSKIRPLSDPFLPFQLLNGLKQLSITKKSLWSLENKKYTFLVSPKMTKPFIRLAIETYFGVGVKKINTLNISIKKKSIRSKAQLKKAVVSFDSTDQITLFSDI